ncbi:spore coat protein YsxE [Mesobacillus foraminis]|uniref:Spore coat protein YsxE n=1 Tax=Mesobacillus foraminis TaxID=279826 RepID=A0A4R2BF73_9BACI|nr:spore coat protein YsxE [Mesobacillus foraminis]TCN24549.1 spore coat protein YsxE [Mesobacillus foraminis]
MDNRQLHQEEAAILSHYGIRPAFIEEFGRIKKVYSSAGTFALKKIDPHSGIDFIRHIQLLYQKGYNRIVPVYPASDGRYAVFSGKSLYYLMPWLSDEEKENRTERPFQLLRELARMHTLSAREVAISQEDRKNHYEKTIKQWEKDEEFLTGFIEDCENEWYMSPLQLTFCLYYNNIRQAMGFAKEKLTNWQEKTKDQKKGRMVLLHGRVSTEHFLYDDKGYGYFINFENARLGSPIQDLLPFLARSLKTRPKRSEECVEWIQNYLKYFPFKEEERLLFLSYLAYPTGMIRTAEAYHLKKKLADERKLVQKLQQQYWHLKNIEYVAMRLEEIERERKQQAQAQQEEAQS